MAPFIRWDSFVTCVSRQARPHCRQRNEEYAMVSHGEKAAPPFSGSRSLKQNRIPGDAIAPPGTLHLVKLLNRDFGAGLFEDLLDLLGLFLGDTFFDGLWRAFDEVLGFLQTERGDL